MKSIFLLAYPDNPCSAVFIETFLRKSIPLRGVFVEKKAVKSNQVRLLEKLRKDGLSATVYRVFQIIKIKVDRKNVIAIACKNHIPVYYVDDFNSKECVDLLKALNIDLLAIASAPVLKPEVLKQAKIGCLNAHPGWLPKYRGIGANAYALADGDKPGVTVHWVDEGIDTGKIIQRERLPLQKNDTVAKINDRAVERGAEMMCEAIAELESDRPKLLETEEKQGPVYKAMPYKEVKIVNRKLKKTYDKTITI